MDQAVFRHQTILSALPACSKSQSKLDEIVAEGDLVKVVLICESNIVPPFTKSETDSCAFGVSCVVGYEGRVIFSGAVEEVVVAIEEVVFAAGSTVTDLETISSIFESS